MSQITSHKTTDTSTFSIITRGYISKLSICTLRSMKVVEGRWQVLNIDPTVMEHVPNALEAITKGRQMCKDLQHSIHSMNILF